MTAVPCDESEADAAELYTIPEVAKILGLAPPKLRYWIQIGLVTPAVRRGGHFYYTLRDLVSARAAAELTEAGVPAPRVRGIVRSLAGELGPPDGAIPEVRVVSDGARVAVTREDDPRPPGIEPVIATFTVRSVAARAVGATGRGPPSESPAQRRGSGYRRFLHGAAAEERGDEDEAESAYAEAAALEPGLAAAHANLGVLRYRRGDREGARAAFERALERDPDLAEARFNLANLAADEGEIDVAIAELRRVCSRRPDYADAHYNLAVLLARVGGFGQARGHLERFLESAPGDAWAARAEAFLSGLPAR